MSQLRFKCGGQSFAAGELVFHDHLREFGAVEGVNGGLLLVRFPSRGEYGGVPELLRTGPAVAEAKTYAEALESIDPDLAAFFLREFASGSSVAEFAAVIRAGALVPVNDPEAGAAQSAAMAEALGGPVATDVEIARRVDAASAEAPSHAFDYEANFCDPAGFNREES